MTKQSQFDIILFEILKRKRKFVPDVLLTGKRFSLSSSKYNIVCVDRTLEEQNIFGFTKPEPEPEEFWSLGSVNLNDFETELIYLKLFTKTNSAETSQLKYLTKSTSIIKITDFNDKIFYMYIKLYIKGKRQSCDDDDDSLKYRIVYSSSFDDLVTFIYKPKEIPDFLNSEAFISKEDKTIDQLTIIKKYNESFIKNVDDTLSDCTPVNITVNFNTRTILASTSKYTYSTQYKSKHEMFVNEIITKGSNTISVKMFISNDNLHIIISNDIETLKSFCLKEITKCKQIDTNEVEVVKTNSFHIRSYCQIQ